MVVDTLLVVPLTRREPPLARQVKAAVRAGAGAIELRVDLIRDEQAVAALLRHDHPVPYILTVRCRAEGGAWEGTETERLTLLARLAEHRPDFVDVELATWERSADLRRRLGKLCGQDQASAAAEPRTGAGQSAGRCTLILSTHDFAGTPAGLDEVFGRLSASPAGVIKAVFSAADARDALRVLEPLHRHGGRRRMIALAMGEAGLPTRVLARKFGAALTFATVAAGAESAPGQPTLDELREVYRWDALRGTTRVFGVIGWPVTHSRGPRLHNAAMAAGAIDGVYLPFAVKPDYADLAAFLDYATGNNWLDLGGASVTLPHKEHVVRWLDERGFSVSELARRCGAVNTLARDRAGNWYGDNTDTDGVIHALETAPELAGGGLRRSTVDVLGAGGVARAAVAALVERGCRVTIYNRSEPRARSLAQELRCDWRAWERRAAGDGRILVNCTSVGMAPGIGVSPVASERLRPGTVVLDTVYTPARTRLLREAEARGCRVIGGIEMFCAQAARQHELWHGRPAPAGVLRQVIDSSL